MTGRRRWLERFLRNTPFFGGLDDQQLERLMTRLVERELDAGATVFAEGDQGLSMYIVESGELIARQRSGAGHSVKLMRLGPGDFFGETTLIEMHPRPFTVVVDSSARLHELTNMDLYRLYQEDVGAYILVLQNINRELCRRLRRASGRVTEMADDLDDLETTQLGMKVVRVSEESD